MALSWELGVERWDGGGDKDETGRGQGARKELGRRWETWAD